jgi:hypothetical protein
MLVVVVLASGLRIKIPPACLKKKVTFEPGKSFIRFK